MQNSQNIGTVVDKESSAIDNMSMYQNPVKSHMCREIKISKPCKNCLLQLNRLALMIICMPKLTASDLVKDTHAVAAMSAKNDTIIEENG